MPKEKTFDSKEYKKRLQKKKETLEKKIAETKIRIGQVDGPMQSWSSRLWDDLTQEVEILKGQLKPIKEQLAELEALEKKKPEVKSIGAGNVVEVEIEGERESFFISKVTSDPGEGILSIHSPIGKALLGCKVGEEVVVRTPQKVFRIKVFRIK